jgi:hypothetical protein
MPLAAFTRGLLAADVFLLPMKTSFASVNNYRWLNNWNPKGNELSYCYLDSNEFLTEIIVGKCFEHR